MKTASEKKTSGKRAAKKYTATQLRQEIYKVLDTVLETGVPVEVERRGRALRISAVEAPDKLDRLAPHPDYIVGDPEELVHLDWSAKWRPYV